MSYRETPPQRRLDTAERFVEYSRGVLRRLKADAAHGAGVDPDIIEHLERTIRKHEPAKPGSGPDLSEKIDGLMAIGRRRRHA